MKIGLLYRKNREIFLLVLGTFLGAAVSILTQSLSASRSEHFQLEQQRRADIKAAQLDIQSVLAAIRAKDDDALNAAVEKLKASTLYLPDYQEMIMPLLIELLNKRSEVAHYRIQSAGVDVTEGREKEHELAEIEAKGWGRLRIEAMDLEIKLLTPPT